MIDRNDESLPSDDPQLASSDEISDDPAIAEPDSLAEAWSGDDIEEAYQKALAAMDDVPWQTGDSESPAPATGEPGAEPLAENLPADSIAETATDAIPTTASSAPAEEGPRLASGTERHPQISAEDQGPQVTPTQIIEAALFVGGGPLSAKKICALLRGSFDVKFVTTTIDELNEQYASEARPYEIVQGDGGYRLELRNEYEKLRQRVYGSGPREVKLSQDVLEVLALVAYQQPISQPEVESHGKQNAGNLLRQLLRRDLVSIQRGEGGRKDIRYLTTPRFLQVFGLGSIEELPQPDDLARK